MESKKQTKNQMISSVVAGLTKKEKQLESRKKELMTEDPFADPERLNDNAAADTEAAEQFGHERISAMNREIDRMLIRIRKTLTRIKLGKFGICESCKRMIDTDRLRIDPTVQYCVSCAKKKAASTER